MGWVKLIKKKKKRDNTYKSIIANETCHVFRIAIVRIEWIILSEQEPKEYA